MTKFIKRLSLLLLFLLVLSSCGSSDEKDEQGNASSSTVSSDQNKTEIATIDPNKPGMVKVYEKPDTNSKVTHEIKNPRDVLGSDQPTDLVFTINNDVDTPEGWLNVNLAVKPNGSTGWIKDENLSKSTTSYKIKISKSQHNLEIFHDGKMLSETSIAVGRGDAETPEGNYYITELIESNESANPVYGPYAYGISAFSEKLEEFNGEEPIIGIHGTNDPGSIGTDVSSGCIRVPNDFITEMTQNIPLGTPVEITA